MQITIEKHNFLACLILFLCIGSTACESDTNKNGTSEIPDSGPRSDRIVCNLPPSIDDCIPPPNEMSKTNYYCAGCRCTGAMPVPTCHKYLSDCRYFATGCHPEDYVVCSDPTISPTLMNLCASCFLRDAGPIPAPFCDKLSAPVKTTPDGATNQDFSLPKDGATLPNDGVIQTH